MVEAGVSGLAFEWPGALWALAALPLLLLPFVRGVSGPRSLSTALALRGAAALLVVLVVAGLHLQLREPADDLCVVVATDRSESVGPDGEAVRGRLVGDLLRHLRGGDRLGAVSFARGVEVVTWPSSPPSPPPAGGSAVDPSATRLEAAIEAAVPLCPEGTARKVVLVTDGNETVGDARRAAAFARQSDVRLFAVVPGDEVARGLSFEKLVAPPLVREGSVFPVRLVVRNRGAESVPGTIDLLLNGAPVAGQAVRLDPGVNVFEIPYRLHERGSYRLGARIAAGGGDADSHREVTLAVAGPIRALVVGDAGDTPLGEALRLKDVDVEFVRPKAFPPLEELLQYHCVILDDVPRRALPDAALATLETYVRRFGGGFVLAGGVRSFGDKAWQDSAVETLLPVSFVEQKPPPKGRAAMGVFLLIDRSNSMSYNSRRREQRDGEKMSYAKQAARALVQQLRPEDRVGVIAFDSDPYVLGPLRPLSEHRGVLEERIARLLPGGGTDFKASLEIAAAQLAGSGLGVRHVILLTDGDTNRGATDHLALIEALARMNISVTTIRIGDDDVNLELLRRISDATGGRFYHVRDIESLPQLIVSDTRKVGKDAEKPSRAAPTHHSLRVGDASPVVRGIADAELPKLRTLVRSELKSGADVLLYGIEERRRVPLLATWQIGLGRTAAFTLDPRAREVADWVSWPGFGKLWSQLVRWAIREETPWETRHVVRFEEGHPVLEVQTYDPSEEGTLVAQVFTAPDTAVEVQLVPAAPRLYRAPLPPLPSGRYALLLSRRIDGKPVSQKRDVLVVEESLGGDGTAELARKLPDLELLRDITTETGGSLNPATAEVVERYGATHLVRQRLDPWLVPLALVFLLGDIWIRRRA